MMLLANGLRRLLPAVRDGVFDAGSAGVSTPELVGLLSQGDIDEVANALGLKKVASGANVELIVPYDAGVSYNADEIESALVASPIQLHLNLWSRHGREEEAADFLYRELIKPRWQV